MASKLESDLQHIKDCDWKWLDNFDAEKTQLVLFDWSNNTGAIDVKMDSGVVYSKLDWGSYIIFIVLLIAKTASKKIGVLISWLYFYKSTKWPGMEHCCHIWAVAPNCYLEL